MQDYKINLIKEYVNTSNQLDLLEANLYDNKELFLKKQAALKLYNEALNEEMIEYKLFDELVNNQDIESLIKNWRIKFKLDVKESDKILDNIKNLKQNEIDLAFKLIKEELEETYKALSEKNVTETFDGIGDIIVTLWQLFSIIGLNTEQLTEIVRIVTESNMSKACETQSEVEDTIASYNLSFDDVEIDTEDKNFMLVFRKDGKLLKNYYFKQPNFKQFIKSLEKI